MSSSGERAAGGARGAGGPTALPRARSLPAPHAQIVVRLQPDEAIYLKLIVKRPGERGREGGK